MAVKNPELKVIARPEYDVLAEPPYDPAQSADFKVCDFWFEARLPNEQILRASSTNLHARDYLDKTMFVTKTNLKDVDVQQGNNNRKDGFLFVERAFLDESWFSEGQDGTVARVLYKLCKETNLN